MSTLLLIAALMLQVQPAPLGVVTGQVVGPDGKPLAGVRIAAKPVQDDGSTADVLVGAVQTDADGRYRLELPVGRYRVAAGRADTPIYYPGVAAENSAGIVRVAAGSQTADVNFSGFSLPEDPKALLRQQVPAASGASRAQDLYRSGVEFSQMGRYEPARINFRVLMATYPDSPLLADAKYAYADSFFNEGTRGALETARREFEDFAAFFRNIRSDEVAEKLKEIDRRLSN